MPQYHRHQITGHAHVRNTLGSVAAGTALRYMAQKVRQRSLNNSKRFGKFMVVSMPDQQWITLGYYLNTTMGLAAVGDGISVAANDIFDPGLTADDQSAGMMVLWDDLYNFYTVFWSEIRVTFTREAVTVLPHIICSVEISDVLDATPKTTLDHLYDRGRKVATLVPNSDHFARAVITYKSGMEGIHIPTAGDSPFSAVSTAASPADQILWNIHMISADESTNIGVDLIRVQIEVKFRVLFTEPAKHVQAPS